MEEREREEKKKASNSAIRIASTFVAQAVMGAVR